MKVHNLNGTSDNDPRAPFGSWIQYWRAYKGTTPVVCPRCGRLLVDPVGAHVQKDTLLDRSWYIVPICRGCNQAKTSFDVDLNLLLRATL